MLETDNGYLFIALDGSLMLVTFDSDMACSWLVSEVQLEFIENVYVG